MNFKKGDLLEVEIEDLAFGGAGIAKIKSAEGDFAIFVESGAPGDKVRIELTKIKKKYAEAKLQKILALSADRAKPRCKHSVAPLGLFGACGGCSLQFLNYENQLKWKEKIVREALERLGGFKNPPVLPIIGCRDPWHYRNKMEYSFGAASGSAGAQTHIQGASCSHKKKLTLGLHPSKNYKEVFDMEECFLQSPVSVQITLAVKKWVTGHGLEAFDPRSSTGLLRNLVIREGKNTGELMVNLVQSGDEFALEKEFAEWITAQFPQITSLYRTSVKIKRGFKTVVEEFLLAGKPTLSETLTVETPAGEKNSLDFDILPQAFFQPNTKQAQTLYGKILEFADLRNGDETPQKTVLDLFCGTGTIGMFFAKCGASMIGIDSNQSAIANANKNAERNSITNAKFFCADVYNLPSSLEAPFIPSLLVTDPPRAGIAAKALAKILAMKIPKWIYVSCNPSTLARDLKSAVLSGYKIERIQPVDMFPQTYHIETVCLLKKSSMLS